jgi:chloride channel 3/4/5
MSSESGVGERSRLLQSRSAEHLSPTTTARVKSWHKRASDLRTWRRLSGNVKTLRELADDPIDYDQEFREDLAGPNGNGVRVWYANFSTIDWIHDAIKESHRLKRIRGLPGLRGWTVNLLDRSQGWIIVTITGALSPGSHPSITPSANPVKSGLLTACVAGIIVTSEMWLFDLKDGHCTTDWRKAKRFCCPAPSRAGCFVRAWAVNFNQECPAWRTWSETFEGLCAGGRLQGANWLIDYAVYLLLAVCCTTRELNIL